MKADKKLLARLQTEADTAYLYRRVASMENDPEIRSIYLEMVRIEELHQSKVMEKVRAIDKNAMAPSPSIRARTISKLGGLFGRNMIL
ncbi:MAG: rubrerythrin family protein, partial [Bacteroidetes bacterium]|nr:rubrerythrin family protein [Bacteroidota bacterium]